MLFVTRLRRNQGVPLYFIIINFKIISLVIFGCLRKHKVVSAKEANADEYFSSSLASLFYTLRKNKFLAKMFI